MSETAGMFAPLNREEIAATPMVAVMPAEEWTPIIPIPGDAPRAPPRHRLGKPASWFPYKNAAGATLFLVARFNRDDGTKEFAPLTFWKGPGARQEMRWKGLAAPRPIYHQDQIAARLDAPVLVCEGEKAADAAEKLFSEYVTTTSPNGAKSARKADWSPLAGRVTTIWPDHDDEGRAYAAAVKGLALSAGAAKVSIAKVPAEFPNKWNLGDAPPAGWDPDKLRRLLNDAAGPVQGVVGADAFVADEPDFQERAAIVEYGAGVPRAWAEGFARLDSGVPPGDVPPKRWRRFIDDSGRFLDGGWAPRAATLGWGPQDLFGCDRTRPFARIDRAGLLWLLDGRKLMALTGDAATIETPSGGRLTYRRRSNEPGYVTLAWDLESHHE